MARRSMSITLGIALVSAAAAHGQARAQGHAAVHAASPLETLEQALPAGWTLLVTASELVIRHDRPCYVTGAQHENAPAEAPPAKPSSGGAMVTIELRYHLEPRWTDKQIAAAKTSNEHLGGELRALAARYRVDTIHHSKGRPLPATPDERSRLDAYEAAEAPLAARIVKLPRCSVGDLSVFDGADTYAQLSLTVDPPEVMTQAYRIVELMKRHCG